METNHGLGAALVSLIIVVLVGILYSVFLQDNGKQIEVKKEYKDPYNPSNKHNDTVEFKYYAYWDKYGDISNGANTKQGVVESLIKDIDAKYHPIVLVNTDTTEVRISFEGRNHLYKIQQNYAKR